MKNNGLCKFFASSDRPIPVKLVYGIDFALAQGMTPQLLVYRVIDT